MLRWLNLKYNKCPKCDDDLAYSENNSGYFHCDYCGFTISERRFVEIVKDLVERQIKERSWRPEDEAPEPEDI